MIVFPPLLTVLSITQSASPVMEKVVAASYGISQETMTSRNDKEELAFSALHRKRIVFKIATWNNHYVAACKCMDLKDKEVIVIQNVPTEMYIRLSCFPTLI